MAKHRAKKNLAKLAFIVLCIALAPIAFNGFYNFLTGLSVFETSSYTEFQKIYFNGNGNYTYEWVPENKGIIEEIEISGTAASQGKASVYLLINGSKKLIYSMQNKIPQAHIKRIPEENIKLNNSKRWINIFMDYENDKFYDEDNNGIEETTGVVDLTIRSSSFNVIDPMNKTYSSKLCSQWEVYSLDSGEIEQLCYGPEECCSLLELPSSRPSWNNTFYASYNKNKATSNNVVSSRIIYGNVNNLSVSDWRSLPVNFRDRLISFEGACGDVCYIGRINQSKYNFIFEIDGSEIEIDKISYNLVVSKDSQALIQKKFIPTIAIDISSYSVLNLSEYFESSENIEYTMLPSSLFDIKIDKGIAVMTALNNAGTLFTYIIANDSKSIITSNIFAVNITEPSSAKEETKPVQSKARVGQPVKWKKKIKPEESSIEINITSEASNITIKKSESNEQIEDSKIKVKTEKETKSLREFNIEKEIEQAKENKDSKKIKTLEKELEKTKSSITASVIEESQSLSEEPATEQQIPKENLTLIIEGISAEEIEIEYETEPPTATEINLSQNTKQITISSDIHYTNITAFTQIKEAKKEFIRLHWIVGGERTEIGSNEINYLDYNNNGLIEEIEWIVPNLSNQTYELTITVLNIHSYPTLYGNWTTEFNTTGTANLTISAISTTTYSEIYNDNLSTKDDLELLELKCGNNLLFSKYESINAGTLYLVNSNEQKIKLENTINNQIPIKSVYVENYNCDNNTGYHTVRTLTTGAHYQLFNFSGQAAEAYNTVSGETCDEGTNTTLCVINTIHAVTSGSRLQYNNLTLQNGGSLVNNSNGTFFTINASSIIIESGGSIIGNVNITAYNITIQNGGIINASYIGYSGGASGDTSANSGNAGTGPGAGQKGDGSGGGQGGGGAGYGSSGGTGFGSTSNSVGGTSYGTAVLPLEYGSGGAGGDCSNSRGGFGGGFIFINITGILNITGNITANGENTPTTICGENGAYSGGGGSGGSILILTSSISGSGSITSNGGTAGGGSSQGGGGSGGRIAVYYNSTSFNGTALSTAGTGFTGGFNGTNFTARNLSAALTLSPVIIDSALNLTINGRFTIYEHNFNLSNQTINIFLNGIKLYVNSTNNLLTNFSSDETTGTAVNSNGIFNYNITAPNNLAEHTIKVNVSFSGIIGENSTTFTISNTPPIINGTINNTSPKKNEIINATFNVTDVEGLSRVNISFNVSGNPQQMFSFSVSGTSASVSQNITVNLTRGNVLNVTGFVIDAVGNVVQNSTLITVVNSAPSAASITNSSGLFFNKNVTINWTATDADNDLLNFTIYFSRRCPPKSTEFSYNTSFGFFTNMTRDGRYCLKITTSDGTNLTNSTSDWNITLDKVAPVVNITINNTSPIKNEIINVTLNLFDNNLLTSNVNISLNISGSTPFAFNYSVVSSRIDNVVDVNLTKRGVLESQGNSVATGDFNGDGYSDAIVGAYLDDDKGGDSGAAYIYFGGPGMDNIIDVNMTAFTTQDQLGYSVASAGDVNGDGYDDAIVGANFYDGGGASSGAAFIYFGGANMDNTIDVNLTGVATNDNQGYSVASAGDVNGDGYDDVIVGAYLNDGNGADSGAAFIYYGGANMPNNTINVNLTGVGAGDKQGSSVASAGDINEDGYSDVIVGAWKNDGRGSNSGAAFIYFGGANMPNNTIGVNLTGVNAGDSQGMSVASAGDVNGDGHNDVVVGSYTNDGRGSNSGAAFIYFGGPNMSNNTINVNLTGVAAGDQQGISVSSAGDVNGDGYSDVIVGASANDGGGSASGVAFVYFGGANMRNNTINANFTGFKASDSQGSSVSSGDFNGDGYGEVVVGAPGYDGGGSSSGAAFIYFITQTTEISQNITINLTRNNVINITGLVIDPAGNANQKSTLITILNSPSTSPTIINTSGQIFSRNQTINWTSPDADNDAMTFKVYFSLQCPPSSDEFMITTDLNFTTNMTLDGTYCLNITANDSIALVNSTSLWNLSLDTALPVVNVSVNKSAPRINDVINITLNLSDTSGLLSANLTINISENQKLNFSFEISGTSAVAHQNITINLTRGNVLNITGFVFDRINNTMQNSTLITVANTPPPAATILNTSGQLFIHNQTIAWTATDADNDSLNYTVYFSLQCPPNSLEFITTRDSNYTTNMTAEGVYCLNITVNNLEFSINASSLWNISINTSPDTVTPTISLVFNRTVPQIFDSVNITLNLSDERELRSANLTLNLSGSPPINFSFDVSGRSALASQNITINLSRGNVINITGYVRDDAGNMQQASTLITVNNSLPTLSITNASGLSYSRNQTINWSSADNDGDLLNFTVYFSKCINRINKSTEFFYTTDFNFTTNMTRDRRYCLNITVNDGIALINLTTLWNTTLDTIIPNISRKINNTSPKRFDVINVTLGLRDEKELSSSNITFNMTGSPQSFNYSVGMFAFDSSLRIGLYGVRSGDRQGYSVSSAGDVNGDGYDDVIVGAYLNNGRGTDSGAAFIYFGGPNMDTAIDVNLTGLTASDYQGYSVSSAGDVNGDGYGDVIVSSYLKDDKGGNSGAAFIYFGGANMPNNTINVNLTGARSLDSFGYSVSSAGDVNGDGYGDVIVGAYGNDNGGSSAGAAYIYFGGANMRNNTRNVNLTGMAAGDQHGISVSSAGDVNGDGYGDVIVGANGNDNGGSNSGAAFIYFGGANMPNMTNNTLIGVNLTGMAAGDQHGISVSSAGDVNGDGYGDVIVGASYNNDGGSDSGAAYIYYGGANMPNNTINVNLTGIAAGDYQGTSVASAGDVNGDGYGDVIVGAYLSDSGGLNSGSAYIYYGGANMQNNTININLTRSGVNDYQGISVSSAGDVDDDGYNDVIVGAFSDEDSISSSGAAFIYLGGGQSDQPSQNITINLTRGNAINITGTVFDKAGNKNQTSTLITVADTVAFNLTINTNNSNPRINEIINITSNVTDYDILSFGVISLNLTGRTSKINYSFQLSGLTASLNQNITINLSHFNVINLTIFINDTTGTPIYQNSTLITIANTIPTSPTIIFPSNNSELAIMPLPVNFTYMADTDSDSLTAYIYINKLLNQTSANNISVNLSDGTYNLSISLYDGTDFSANTTINFTYDTTSPTIDIYRKDRITTKKHIIINGTINETNTVQNITIEMNASYIANASFNNQTRVFNVTVNLTEGWNRFNVYAYDKAGNFRNTTSTSQGASALSDTTPTTVNLISPPNSSTVANGSLISFEVTDKALSSVFYQINNNTFNNFNFIFDIEARTPEWVDGTNYIIINATDQNSISTINNYTFQFSTSYDNYFNSSYYYMLGVINKTNTTKNNLLNSTELQSLLSNSGATLDVATYNSTINSLGVITNLTNAITSLKSLLTNIVAINSSSASEAIKTTNISSQITTARIVRNNTFGEIRVSVYDSNISGASPSTAINSNVTTTISNSESLSSSDQSSFESSTSALQSITTVTNAGSVMEIIYVNGRQINSTLFEKQINITTAQDSFYINEYIDKNITGDSSFNASQLVNKADSGTFSILVEDPIVRWLFTSSKSATIRYTVPKSVDTSSLSKAKTVITPTPTITTDSSSSTSSSSSSSSGSSSGGGGGAATPSQAPADARAFASRIVESASPENSAVITVTNPDIGINKITIDVVNDIKGAEISVSSLKEAPQEQKSAPSSSVYQYLRVEKQNIDRSDMKKASLEFKVPKEWINENNLAKNDISLFRLKSDWEQLPTRTLREDDSNIYFESVSEGFSLFAIGKKKERLFSLSMSSSIEEITVGSEKTIEMNITNLIEENVLINLELNGINGKISEPSFNLAFGEKHTVYLYVKPESSGVSLGKIVIEGKLTIEYSTKTLKDSKDVPIILNVVSPTQKYYVNVKLEDDALLNGDEIKAWIKISNASANPLNAVINYFIKDADNNIYYKESQSVYIDKETIYKSIPLTSELRTGKYAFVVDLVHEGGVESYAVFFTIEDKAEIFGYDERVKSLERGILVLLIVILLNVLGYRLYSKKTEYKENHNELGIYITINKQNMVTKQGGVVLADFSIYRKSSTQKKYTSQANLEISFLNSKNKKINSKMYPLTITNSLKFSRKFSVPIQIKKGKYILFAKITCDGFSSNSGAWFTVN